MMAILAEPLRVCLDCGLEAHDLEDLELFKKDKRSKYGKANLCNKCKNKRQKEYCEANPEKYKEYNRKYRETHPEKIRESNRKYRKDNPEKIKEIGRKYYKANTKKLLKNQRRYREAHPFKLMFRRVKARSERDELPFDLTLEYLWKLWDECGGICTMTGVLMQKTSDHNDQFVMSLDRITPYLGYVKGNVRLVSNWYNLTRRHWGDAFTLEMCQRVAERAYSPKMIEILGEEGVKVNG